MASETVSKSVIWQLTGKFFLQGIAFFTAPVFTRLLSPEDYGYTALYSSWCSIFTLAIGLMTYGSIQNARMKYERREMDGYLSSVLSISIISFSICLLFGGVFRNFLSMLFGIRQDIVILVIIQSFFTYVINFYIGKLDSFKQVEKSTLISISQSVLVVVVSLVAVIHTEGNKAVAKIYSSALPPILYGLVLIGFIYRKGKVLWNSSYNKFCLALTLPLLVHGLGGLVFSQSDRIMLTKLQGEEMLGIYSVSYALCNVLVIIKNALNISWVPFYMDYKKQDCDCDILKHSRRYIKLFTCVCIGFTMLSHDVFKILAPEKYWEGTVILPTLVLAVYFSFLYLFPVNFEFYYCRTKLIPVVTFMAALINIAVNFALIPNFGLIGAATGTLIAHFFEFLFHWIGAALIIKEKFEYTFLYFLLGTVSLVGFVIIAVLLKEALWLRWIIATFFGCYLIMDIVKYKSIF